jgi:RND family efflux transporter MFP subunit
MNRLWRTTRIGSSAVEAARWVLPLFVLGLIVTGTTRAQGEGLDCLIEPERTVLVAAPVEAVVATVLVDRAALVEENQVLATLESSVEKAAVASARARASNTAEVEGAEARFAFEERRLARSRKLFGQGVISDNEIDEVESARIVAEADWHRAQENKTLASLELRTAEAALRRRTIRSPLKGVVVDRILSPGEYADPPQLFEVAQIDPLRIEVYAPVSLLGRIQVGMRGRVIPEEPIGGAYDAEVVVVDRVVDAASGTFGVRLALPNPDYALPAGLKCRVEFTAPHVSDTPTPPDPKQGG